MGHGFRRIRQAFAIVFAAFALLVIAPASQATTAHDTWYVPDESGWGVDVVEQGSSFAIGIYVYDQNRNPTWYFGAGSSRGDFVWSGQMYEFTGPYFGGSFNPDAVGENQVGTFSFTLNTVQSATLRYTINGVTVTKALSRFSVANQDLTGTYAGGIIQHAYNCSATIYNGYDMDTGTLSVTQNGTTVSITAESGASSCTYGGAYTQEGRYGRVIGSFSCNNGSRGDFDLFEIEHGVQGFFGRFSGTIQSPMTCSIEGRLGGLNTDTSSF